MHRKTAYTLAIHPHSSDSQEEDHTSKGGGLSAI